LIESMANDQLGRVSVLFRVVSLHLFLFILMNNIVGLIPMGYAVTSQLVVTMWLSFIVCFDILILGFFNLGYNMLYILIPGRGDMPVGIVPFLGLIELLSYAARFVSLGLRLFANMMAGHSLMKILSMFVFNFFKFSFMWDVIIVLPVILIAGILVLELGISVLQAYVFVLLSLIYLSEVINFINIFNNFLFKFDVSDFAMLFVTMNMVEAEDSLEGMLLHVDCCTSEGASLVFVKLRCYDFSETYFNFDDNFYLSYGNFQPDENYLLRVTLSCLKNIMAMHVRRHKDNIRFKHFISVKA